MRHDVISRLQDMRISLVKTHAAGTSVEQSNDVRKGLFNVLKALRRGLRRESGNITIVPENITKALSVSAFKTMAAAFCCNTVNFTNVSLPSKTHRAIPRGQNFF